jgi:hypothetical protein
LLDKWGAVHNPLEIFLWIIGFPFGQSPYISVWPSKSEYLPGEAATIFVWANVPSWGDWSVELIIEDDQGEKIRNWGPFHVDGGYCDTSFVWSSNLSGHFAARGKLKNWWKDNQKAIGANECAEDFVYRDGPPGTNYTLIAWSGTNLKGEPGEEAELPKGHPIAVWIKNAKERVWVTFNSGGKGTFKGGGSIYQVQSQPKDSYIAKKWLGSQTNEIQVAFATFVFDPAIPGPPNFQSKHEIAVKCGDNIMSEYIVAYSFENNEPSHGIEPYTHQKDPETGLEILGDLYNEKGNQMPYYSETHKDVLVKLDWYKWETNVSNATIIDISQLVVQIMQTAGVNCHIEIGTEITDMPPKIETKAEALDLLKDTRGTVSLWAPRIHVILGSTDGDPNTFTRGQTYELPYYVGYPVDQLYMASGDGYRSFTDFCGSIIFAKETSEEINPDFISVEEAIALFAAHEIGHCLGLWHYPESQANGVGHNVMEKLLDLTTEDCFEKYNQFEPKTLCGNFDNGTGWPGHQEPPQEGGRGYEWDGLNTRHVLGINRTALDEYKWSIQKFLGLSQVCSEKESSK